MIVTVFGSSHLRWFVPPPFCGNPVGDGLFFFLREQHATRIQLEWVSLVPSIDHGVMIVCCR
jgi:hypothetical protein